MYPITNAVKALFDAEQPQILRVTGTDKNGTPITITDANVMLNGFSIDRCSTTGSKIEIGTAIASELTLKLDNREGVYDGVEFEGMELFVEIGIADWTLTNPTVSWIPCGYFTPEEQPRSLNTITIHALDRMTRFDVVPPTLTPWTDDQDEEITDDQGEPFYFLANVGFLCTVADLVQQTATRCSVPFSQPLATFPNANTVIQDFPKLQQSVTFRNIIQWCAGLMGTCAYIDWTGSLRFAWYGAADYTTTTANRFYSDLYENDLSITGVRFAEDEETVFLAGSDGYVLDMSTNALAAANPAQAVANVYAAVNGFTYRPFSARVLNAPWLWPLDVITFTDKNGGDHACALTNVNFGINGATMLGGNGETAIVNGLAPDLGVTAQQLALINKVADSVDDLDDSLDAEGVFNRLTNNGEEQGLYWRNGKVYINGTYIQAGEMSADRIKGGMLTLGGANDVNGTLKILDADGNEIGSWSNDGVSIKAGSFLASYGSSSVAINTSDFPTYYRIFKVTMAGSPQTVATIDRGEFEIYSGPVLSRQGNVKITPHYISIDYTNDSTWPLPDGYISVRSYQSDSDGASGYIFPAKSVYGGGWLELYESEFDGNDVFFSAHQYSGFYCKPDAQFGGSVTVASDFTVSGTKSRKVDTDQYSERLLYCYETPSPLFGDVGEGVIGEDGRCYVWLDPMFAQTISTDQYQVFLQRYGRGDCWIAERSAAYFIVEGEPGLAFGWEIKAKQRDFDQKRLDPAEGPFEIPTQSYGENAAQYIIDLRKERETA